MIRQGSSVVLQQPNPPSRQLAPAASGAFRRGNQAFFAFARPAMSSAARRPKITAAVSCEPTM